MPPVALSCRRAMVANRATATLAAKRRATASLWSTAARHARKPRPSRWRSTCAAAEAARQALLPAVRLCAAHAFRRVRSALATVRWSMRAAMEAARVATLPAVRLCVEHAWQNARSALARARWSMRAAAEAARVATLPAVRLCVEHAWQNVRSALARARWSMRAAATVAKA